MPGKRTDLSSFSEADIAVVVDREAALAHSRFHAQEHPRAVLLAGQPGAGKTRLSAMAGLACISRLRIWDRELLQIYDSSADTNSPSAALLGYWHRPWSGPEVEDAWAQVARLRRDEARYSLGQGAVVEELARRLSAVERRLGQ